MAEPLNFDDNNQLIPPTEWANEASPDIRFQPAFNEEVQKYVTGNWPADAEGRYAELRDFTYDWTRSIAEVFPVEFESRSQPPPPGVSVGKLGAGAAAYIRGGDVIAIYIGDGNLKEIASDPSYDETSAKRAIALMIDEEVDHAAYNESVKRKMPEGSSLVEAIQNDTEDIAQSLLNATENRDAVGQALYSSVAMYDPRVPRMDEVDTEDVIGVIQGMGAKNRRVEIEVVGTRPNK
jgi:hypothetical protein